MAFARGGPEKQRRVFIGQCWARNAAEHDILGASDAGFVW